MAAAATTAVDEVLVVTDVDSDFEEVVVLAVAVDGLDEDEDEVVRRVDVLTVVCFVGETADVALDETLAVVLEDVDDAFGDVLVALVVDAGVLLTLVDDGVLLTLVDDAALLALVEDAVLLALVEDAVLLALVDDVVATVALDLALDATVEVACVLNADVVAAVEFVEPANKRPMGVNPVPLLSIIQLLLPWPAQKYAYRATSGCASSHSMEEDKKLSSYASV